MEQLVNFHTQNGVLEIQFNRADKKNALTNAMYQAVQTAMEQAKSDDNIQVILFTSTGDFFTAGKCLTHNPSSCRNNQPGFFQNRNKFGRGNHAKFCTVETH